MEQEGECMRVRARALQVHYTLLRASRYTRALGNVRERKKGGDREGERAREGDVENTLHSRTREGATIGYTYVHV